MSLATGLVQKSSSSGVADNGSSNLMLHCGDLSADMLKSTQFANSMFAPIALDIDDQSMMMQSDTPGLPPTEGSTRRARSLQQVWKSHEVEILQQGVARYGRNWKAILEDHEFAPILGGRSPGSLKLKWYKMTKEHEEKMSVNSRVWGGSGMHQPGQTPMVAMEGALCMPFSTSNFIDVFSGQIPGEHLFDMSWSADEMQALKESTARYGPNWANILGDPMYAQALHRRSPGSLQMLWNQLQGMPKPGSMYEPAEGEDLDDLGEEYPAGSAQALQSMRSWGRLETNALVKGFEVYGTDWKAILHDARFRPHLSHRTAHSLKSKWARMMKKRKRDDDPPMMLPSLHHQSHSQSSFSMGFHSEPTGGGLVGGNGLPEIFGGSHPFGSSPQQEPMDEGFSMQANVQASVDAQEDYDKSIEEYTQKIEQQPANAVLYNHRGVVYYAKGLIDQALDDFSTAIALDCSYADAFTNRGMAFNSKGEFDLAIMDCTTTIDINPTSASATNAFLTRALTHYNKGMLEQCIMDCDATLALRPLCVSALVTRGLTILALAKEGNRSGSETLHNYQMALRDFREAMTIDPSNTQAQVWYEEAMMLLSDPTLQMTGHPMPVEFPGSDGDLLPSAIQSNEMLSMEAINDTLASRFMH